MLSSIMPSWLMPGIIGTSTENAIARAPMIVSFMKAAALGVQKNKGANRSQRPTTVVPHCAHEKRGDRESEPKSVNSRPEAISLHPVNAARKAGPRRPRSRVTSRTVPARRIEQRELKGAGEEPDPEDDGQKMRPEHLLTHPGHIGHMSGFRLFVLYMELFSPPARLRSSVRHLGCIELVCPIPAGWIGLWRVDHRRQLLRSECSGSQPSSLRARLISTA